MWGVFSSFVRYEVGDGSKVRFWHDLLCGKQLLKIYFLDLFGTARGWWIICSSEMEIFNEIYFLTEQCMIGR